MADIQLIHDAVQIEVGQPDDIMPPIVKLYFLGSSCDTIAQNYGVSRRTVQNWINNWCAIARFRGYTGSMLRGYLKVHYCAYRDHQPIH